MASFPLEPFLAVVAIVGFIFPRVLVVDIASTVRKIATVLHVIVVRAAVAAISAATAPSVMTVT